MSGRLPGFLGDTVLDLRTRRTEADRMRPWARRLYQVVLVGLMAAGLVVAGLQAAMLLVPRDYGFAFFGGQTLLVTNVDRTDVDLREEDRVVTVEGVRVDSVPRDPSACKGGSAYAVGCRIGAIMAGHPRVAFAPPDSTPLSRVRGVLHRKGGGDLTLVVERVGDDQAATTHEVVVSPRRRRWFSTVGDAFLGLLIVFVGLLGLMALQARTESPAVARFVQLCVAVGMPLVLINLWGATTAFFRPLSALAATLSPWTIASLLVTSALWAFFFGSTLLRFLHVFPVREARYAEEYPVPTPSRGLRWLLGLILVVVVTLPPSLRLFGVQRLPAPVGLPFMLSLMFVLLVVVSLLPTWIVQTATRVFRLSHLRASDVDPRTDEGQQARLVLFGIRAGVLSFLIIIVAVVLFGAVGVLTSVEPAPEGHLDAADLAFQGLVDLLYILGIAAPFVGIGLAVTRRRLWDVDLVAQRASLISTLGVLFFVLWIAIDQGLGAVLPSGAIPGLGPLLAGTGVALAQAPLSRALTRRFFPTAADVGEALENVSGRLLAADSAEPGARRVGHVLADELRCDRAAVFARNEDGAFRSAWHAWEGNPPAGVAAALASALGSRATVTARTDDGPVLAVRVGPPRAFPAMVVLGPRAGGRFYSAQDRRMLTLLLAPLGPILAPRP